MSFLREMIKDQIITDHPKYIKDGLCYEVIMGSRAYAINKENSDYDMYGFCIPPKHIIFPHTAGIIYGFDNDYEKFEQYQKIKVFDKREREFDFNIYNIVKYFSLCSGCNPNMIDSLFVPQRCVVHINSIGQMVRNNRKIFLSKKCYHTYKGYSYSQIGKMNNKEYKENEERREDIEKYGFDTKHAKHLVRLINQCEQIFVEGDLDLERSKEQLKSIGRGEWKKDDIMEYFKNKETILDKLYIESNVIPYEIQKKEIKKLLIECLEHHYGNLDNCIKNLSTPEENFNNILKDLEGVLKKYESSII